MCLVIIAKKHFRKKDKSLRSPRGARPVTEDVIKMHHQESVSLIFPIDIKISFKICFRKIRRVEEKLGKGDSILLNHETINFPLCFFFLVKL